MFVDLLLMIDYLLQFLDEFRVVFTFWLYLINDLLNFLLDGILSQFWNIFLRIMVKVIIDAVSAEELSIELTISGQFFLFVILASEKLSFYNRLGLIQYLMIFRLEFVIFILDLEVEHIWLLAFLTIMSDPSIILLLSACNIKQTISAYRMAAEDGKERVLLPQRVLTILDKELPSYLRLHFSLYY